MGGLTEQVVARVAEHPDRTALLSDVDGTLAPIVDRPEDARPLPEAMAALRRLAQRLAVVGLVSGRPAPDVVRIAALADDDALVVAGHYGMQTWRAGSLLTPDPDPRVEAVRRALPSVLAGAPAGVSVEDKEHSLVVHTRLTADPAGVLADLAPWLEALAAEHDLEALGGRYVVELRPAGVDKGHAVAELAGPAGTVVYLGDDLGDLPAFALLARWRSEGRDTLAVAVRSDGSPAEVLYRADTVLDGPAAVAAWLTTLADAVG